MRKEIQIVTMLFLLLFVVPLGLPNQSLESAEPKIDKSSVTDEAFPSVVESEVGHTVTLRLTHTARIDMTAFKVEKSGQYVLNCSYHVDWAPSGMLELWFVYYYDKGGYVPQTDDLYSKSNQFFVQSIHHRSTGNTGFFSADIETFGSGYLSAKIFGNMATNESVTVNATVTHLLDYDDFAIMDFGENVTISMEGSDTMNGTKMMITEGLYLIQADFLVPYETTESWGGGSAHPFMMQMRSRTHGSHRAFIFYEPSYMLPSGASTGNMTFHFERYLALPADTYYTFAVTENLEDFNGTLVTMVANLTSVQHTPLIDGTPLDVSVHTEGEFLKWFSFTPEVARSYNISMNWISGGNWSVTLFDHYTDYMLTYLDLVKNDTFMLYNELSVINSGALWYPIGSIAPAPSAIGDPYINVLNAAGVQAEYNNGTLFSSNPSPQLASSYVGTLYFHLKAMKDAVSSSTFNFSINIESEQTRELSEGANVFSYNFTAGSFFYGATLEVTAGTIYELSGVATQYTSSGQVTIEVIPQPDRYQSWGFYYEPGFYAYYPAGDVVGAMAENETATIRWMSVRDETLLVSIMAFAPALGPGISDTTEVSVTLTSIPATEYTLSSNISFSLDDPFRRFEADFASFSFDVVEGYSYQIEMSTDYASTRIYATFINSNGQNPFDVASWDVWCIFGPAHPGNLEFSSAFYAKETGRVYLIFHGFGNVDFTINTLTDWYDQGYDDGYESGYDEGYEEGYFEGVEVGEDYGYDSGYNDGYEEAYDEGYEFGFARGHGDAIGQLVVIVSLGTIGALVVGLLAGNLIGKRKK